MTNKIKRPSLTVQLASAHDQIDLHKASADHAFKELASWKDAALRRAEHIKLFKSERIQMEREIAELRGYLARVLEDDRVREDAQPAEPAVSTDAVQNAQRILEVAARQREFPVQRRTGPACMVPNVSMQYVDTQYDRFGRETSKPAPTPWQDRD